MTVIYRNKKLEDLIKDKKDLLRVLGKDRALLLLRRIDDISASANKSDLLMLPGHYHELSGNRKGQWACSLDQPYRLVFTIEDNTVIIQEIVNYHGK